MINWESVLTSIGSTTTIVLILGFVARSLFKHILKSGLETHKISLKAEFDQKLADLNNSFSLLALEHKVRFSKLHEERAEVIEVLYSNLIDYLDKLTKYFQSGVVGSEGTDQHNEIRNEFSTLRHEYYSKKKIYFTEDLNVIIQKAFETIWKSVADATLFKSNIIEGSDAHIAAFKRANNELQSTGDISKMLNALEKEFRLLLGSVKP